jgi:hypothetical protein
MKGFRTLGGWGVSLAGSLSCSGRRVTWSVFTRTLDEPSSEVDASWGREGVWQRG